MKYSESKQAHWYKFRFYHGLNRKPMPPTFYAAMSDFDLASAVLHGFWHRAAPHDFDVEVQRVGGEPVVVITAEEIEWRGPPTEAFRRLIDLPEDAGLEAARAAFGANIAKAS